MKTMQVSILKTLKITRRGAALYLTNASWDLIEKTNTL